MMRRNLLLSVCIMACVASSASADPILSNGAFTANASQFTTFPGYVGNGSNPAQIADWTNSGNPGSQGVNPGNGAGNPFAPASGGNPSDPQFAFLQGQGSSISQTINGFTSGSTYKLFYDDASRNGYPQATLTTTLGGASNVTTPSSSNFNAESLTFTATGTSQTLTFANSSGPGDITADVSNVVLVNGSTLYNNGFEVPNLGTGGGAYEYGYVPGWTATGGAGVAANGSAFNVTGASNGNSDGTTSAAGQAGVLQNISSLSQMITVASGATSVSFLIENRDYTYGGQQFVNVSLGGHDLGTYTGDNEGHFISITTGSVDLPAGTYDLTFSGVNGNGDNTSFIDNVSLATAVPEPASLTLLGLGGFGLLLARRRKLI